MARFEGKPSMSEHISMSTIFTEVASMTAAMKTRKVLTPQQVRECLSWQGLSVNEWARDHGFSRSSVHAVLNGERGTRYGVAHKIAVTLGMKDGWIEDTDRDHR
jgi:gp16 family phage-associated protein